MPQYEINVVEQVPLGDAALVQRLAEAAERVCAYHHLAAQTGMSIVITDDETVQGLNHLYRQVDAPTDVLSFPTGDTASVPEGEAPYLGDLLLALPYIERQAAREGHRVEDELMLAVVHGTLHLLGYDHDTADHQSAMWAVQRELLQTLGVLITVPEYDFPPDEDGSELTP